MNDIQRKAFNAAVLDGLGKPHKPKKIKSAKGRESGRQMIIRVVARDMQTNPGLRKIFAKIQSFL